MVLKTDPCYRTYVHPAHKWSVNEGGTKSVKYRCPGKPFPEPVWDHDPVEDYAPTPAQAEFQERLEYTEDGLAAVDSHRPMAKVIWEASRADEGSISATGADIIAKALIMAGYGKLSQELPTWPRLVPNADYQGQVWEYEDGHKLYRGMEVPPPGAGDIWQKMDPFMFDVKMPEAWGEQIEPFKAGPGRVMEIPPNPMERIADALEQIARDGIKTVSYNGGDL